MHGISKAANAVSKPFKSALKSDGQGGDGEKGNKYLQAFGSGFAGSLQSAQPMPMQQAPMQGIIPRQDPTGGLFRNYQPQPRNTMERRYEEDPMYRTMGGLPGYRFGGRAPQDFIAGENGPEQIHVNNDGTANVQPLNPIDANHGSMAPNAATLPASQPEQPTQQQLFRGGGVSLTPTAGVMPAVESLRQPTMSEGTGGISPEPVYESPAMSTQQRIDQLDEKGAPPPDGVKHNKSLLSRLGHGLFRGYKNWDGQGGLVGLLASTVEEGIHGAASEKYDFKQQKEGVRQQLFRKRAYEMQQEDFANKQNTELAKQGNYQSEINARTAKTNLDISKEVWDRLDGARKAAVEKWGKMPRYKRGENPALDAEFERSGTVIPDKEPNDRFTTHFAPDGRLVIVNNSSGEIKEGGNYAKANFKLPDDAAVGLEDEKTFENRATARIAPSIKGRQVRSDVVAHLPAKYKNPDGTFNEDAYLKDASNGETDLKPSEIYQDLPNNDKQRIAAEVERQRSGQKFRRQSWESVKSMIENYRAPANPTAEADMDWVIRQFNEAMKQKDPAKAVDQLKDALRNTVKLR